MDDLAEVARAVAEALVLFGPDSDPWYGNGWHSHDHWLAEDGSDLTDPYWRCRCEDWLLERKFVVTLDPREGKTSECWKGVHEIYCVLCPLAEAPARLVAAVWRK